MPVESWYVKTTRWILEVKILCFTVSEFMQNCGQFFTFFPVSSKARPPGRVSEDVVRYVVGQVLEGKGNQF